MEENGGFIHRSQHGWMNEMRESEKPASLIDVAEKFIGFYRQLAKNPQRLSLKERKKEVTFRMSRSE